MAASITRGVRVSIKATYFDENDGLNTWSRKHFGDNYDISYCWGIVGKVENNYARLYWEIGKKISSVPTGLLDIENEKSTRNSKKRATFARHVVREVFCVLRR